MLEKAKGSVYDEEKNILFGRCFSVSGWVILEPDYPKAFGLWKGGV